MYVSSPTLLNFEIVLPSTVFPSFYDVSISKWKVFCQLINSLDNAFLFLCCISFAPLLYFIQSLSSTRTFVRGWNPWQKKFEWSCFVGVACRNNGYGVLTNRIWFMLGGRCGEGPGWGWGGVTTWGSTCGREEGARVAQGVRPSLDTTVWDTHLCNERRRVQNTRMNRNVMFIKICPPFDNVILTYSQDVVVTTKQRR